MQITCYLERPLTVPVLVDHHDAEQHAEREDEDPIDVVRDGVANSVAECNHDHDSGNVEEYPERLNKIDRVNSMHLFLMAGKATYDVSNGPSIIQCPDDQNKLADDVDQEARGREDQVGDEQSDRLCILEPSKVLEGSDGDKEADTPNDEGGQTKELQYTDKESGPLLPSLRPKLTYPE